MRAFISGGGALDKEIGEFLNAIGLPTLQGYGLTETSPVVSCNPIHKIKVETVGPPFKGNEVKIAEDGEILVRGENVMLGYWNKKEETKNVIKNGWLHTGDIGEINPKDGYLKITDRKKDIIVSAGGDNISPAKIENIITNTVEIDQCMVYGDKKNYLVALIVINKEYLKEKFQIHKYILNKKNCGVTIAANQAIKQCNTEYILILAADCLISEKNISILLESHKKYNNCFITSPTYYDKKSNLSLNGGGLPEKNPGMEVLNLKGDVCVETIIDAAILFKRKDIIELGLYDENFFLYYSDFDLCRRILKKKKSIIQIFEAEALHDHGEIKVKNFLKKIFIKHYNFTFDELYYFFKINKHYEKTKKLKKKMPKYIIKSIVNLFLLRFDKSIYYFSKILAFNKFKNFLKSN